MFSFLLAVEISKLTIVFKNITTWYIQYWGKQWQTTPKNLPRMQRTRAIPVAWLVSGSCPN